MTIWAFNRPYGNKIDKVVKFLSESLKEGIARFGWSYIDSADIRQLSLLPSEKMASEEKKIWKKAKFLLNIKENDWIVQINVPDWGIVTAGQVKEGYNFEKENNEIKDFRHFFKLKKETIIEFERDNKDVYPKISKKLKLQGRYWRIYDKEEFLETINKLEIQKLNILYKKTLKLIDKNSIEVSLMYCRKIVEGMLMIIQNKEGLKIDDKSPFSSLDLIENLIFSRYDIENSNLFLENLIFFIEQGNSVVHYNQTENKISVSATQIKEKLSWTLKWFNNFITRQKQESENVFLNSENVSLPVCLKKIEINNYFSLKKIEILNLPVDTQFIVLTGDNGEGKTSILQSIAVGMYGAYDKEGKFTLSDKNNVNIFLEVKYKENTIFNEFRGHNSFSNIVNKHFVAYGASRLQLQSTESQDQKKLRQSNVYGIFRTNNILQNIEYWLKIQKFKQRKERIEAVKDLLISLMPSITKIEIKTKQKSNDYFISYTENNIELQSNELSAGNKSILAMIGDMVIRLFEAQPDTKNTKDLYGIVLIDEIETHLHPKWQKEFPRLLSENFPKIQFVVSTHSPIIFLGLPQNSIIYAIGKDDEKNTIIEKLDVDISRLLPNSILTSPIFNFNNLIASSHKGEEFIETENNYSKIKDNRKIEEEISEYLSDERTAEILELIK